MVGGGDTNSPEEINRTRFIGFFLHSWGQKSHLLNDAEMLVRMRCLFTKFKMAKGYFLLHLPEANSSVPSRTIQQQRQDFPCQEVAHCS